MSSSDRWHTQAMYNACQDTVFRCSKKIDDKLESIVYNEWPTSLFGDKNYDAREAMRMRLSKLFCENYPNHGWCAHRKVMASIFNKTKPITTTLAPIAPSAPPQGPPMAPQAPPQQMIEVQQQQQGTFPPATTEGFLAANISLIIAGSIGFFLLCLIGCSVILYFVKQSSEKKAPPPGRSQMTSASRMGSTSRMDKPRKHRKHRKHPKKEKEPESDGESSGKSSVKGVKSKSLYNV